MPGPPYRGLRIISGIFSLLTTVDGLVIIFRTTGPGAGDAGKRNAEEKDLSLDLSLSGSDSLAVLYHLGHANAKAIIAYLKSLPTPIR